MTHRSHPLQKEVSWHQSKSEKERILVLSKTVRNIEDISTIL
tara:strand:+ start:125 stop:250 length:126 start_codon:yes stop_codon:yes gene_type:complete